MTPFIVRPDGLYTRGTLAQRLDRRALAHGEPRAEHLPATINPLRFLWEHLLGANARIVRVRQDCMQGGAPFLPEFWPWFSRPECATLLFVELTPLEDTARMLSVSQIATVPVGVQVSDSTATRSVDVLTLSGKVCA